MLINFIIQHMKGDTQDLILQKLVNTPQLRSDDLKNQFNLTSQAIYGELISLSNSKYINLQHVKSTKTILTQQGNAYAKQGTPEARIFQLATKEGTPKEVIEAELKEAYKIGFGNAMKKKIISLKNNLIFRDKQVFEDEQRKKLVAIAEQKQQISKEDLKLLKGRKLIKQIEETTYIITKGEQFRQKKVEFVPELTSAMIADKSWQKAAFKKFNPLAKGLQIQSGNLHHLLKTRQQFVEILIEMGFEQMDTSRYVQSSFWNFDSLFQPQAHPARDAHDTFFISHPDKATVQDKEYFENVKNVHQKGGYGSCGYDYQWQPKQAYKNILRTHTTAISSRYLKMIAEQKPFRPRKFFSIDRVFRNQTLDNTHLAQFHQVEGFVIDRNLGLHHLIGILTEFYKKIGVEKIWLKPTYNPYTEPSMEIFGYHPILKRKVQLGNSGIFRPEMLRPMGFPEDVSVVAWGLGLQRPTMIQFDISNIKQLLGPAVNIKRVKDSAIFCL